MLLAELEIWHSRPIAPTRRVAVGRKLLPTDPPPGFGGLLLGGIVAASIDELDPELGGEVSRLINDLEAGRRVPQPRLRHRLQVDRIGLARSHHRLVDLGDSVHFDLEHNGSPAAQILGAVYAAGALPSGPRSGVMSALRRSLRWRGPIGPAFVANLSGMDGARVWSALAFGDPVAWALDVLGFPDGGAPRRVDVQQRFRALLRHAHPDHGGDEDDAARRILDLTEARRILLAASAPAL
ncbi:MAG: hypothetical protein KY438_06950 [Actinobacteria bacterium]|nr:hypothetical protein [Actinomycetota bacterium]